jgi:hypothetical protein
MSTLENTVIQEKILENVTEIFQTDYDLRGELAHVLLEGVEYYLYCKDDAWEYLEDHIDTVAEKVFEYCGEIFPNSIEYTKEIIKTIYGIE